MKVDVEIMEILAAYDLTGTLRAAAELTGCSHHTVARHVAARDAGQPISQNLPIGAVSRTRSCQRLRSGLRPSMASFAQTKPT